MPKKRVFSCDEGSNLDEGVLRGKRTDNFSDMVLCQDDSRSLVFYLVE
jgi:hypothetical protein